MHPAVTVRDQGGTSSCVGFAWAQALELAWAHQGVLTGDLSPLALYFWARATHGAAGVDGGTYLRAAAKVAVKLGVPRESTHPFARRRVTRSPAWQAYRDAYDRRGRGYYRVHAHDLEGVRTAIASGLPVVGGWDVDRAFTEHDGDGVIDDYIAEPIGGHALAIVGYDEDSFLLLNSWGIGWGRAGYARVTPAFVRRGVDLWAVDVR